MTTTIELPNTITTLTLQEGLDALSLGWTLYFGAPPDRPEKLLTLAAQSILETGWFRSMHCFNFGNVKARPGGAWSWTYFACNEILTPAAAAEAARRSVPDARVRVEGPAAGGKIEVWFYPKHAAACFRAFESVEQGAADHIALLNSTRFSPAWEYIDAGAPVGFAFDLARLGYYTANPDAYAASLDKIFTDLSGRVAGGELALHIDPLPSVPPELAAMAIAARDRSLHDDAFIEHDYPETSDEA